MIASLVAIAGLLDQSNPPIKYLGGENVHTHFQSKIDPKTKVILFSTGDCDGAHRRAYLTSDSRSVIRSEHDNEATDSVYWKEFVVPQLKPASVNPVTDRGIRLGMTMHQVTAILGKPTSVVQGQKVPGTQYIYRWTKAKLNAYDLPLACKNYYVFRKGLLVFIEFNSDLIGGT